MNYVDTPNSNLMCCICHAPFIVPTTTKACMHTFCRDCIFEAIKHAPQCPIDRLPLSPDDLVPANPIVKHLVDELIVECSQRELGCEHTCQRQLLSSHLKDACQYVTLTCSKEGCEEIILRKDIDKHAEACGRRTTQCDGCGVTVRVSELDTHNEECPCKTFTCPNCISELPRSEFRAHESTCPDLLVSCDHQSFGCSWTGTRRTLTDVHGPSCAYESIKGFLKHSAERQDTLAAENALLRERVSALDGLTQAMRRELHALKASLGPWYRPGGGDLSQTEAPYSTNSTWSRPAMTPSSPPASGSSSVTAAAGSFSDPRLSLTAFEPFDTVYPASAVPYEHEDPLASYFPPPEDSTPLTPASAPAYESSGRSRSFSHSHSHSHSHPHSHSHTLSQSSTIPAHHAHSHPPHHAHAHAHTLPPPAVATPVAPLNLSTSLEGTLGGLRESIAAVGATVDSLARRTDIALTHEAMRVGEDVASLRYAVQGIRVQLHRMMMDRNAQVTGRMGEPGPGPGSGVAVGPGGAFHPPMLSPLFPGPSPGTKL